ncbi:unnamed protein product [Brugia timori]|uniref:G_PROTEIN_RECEP_F1_2 domain-containing protein n=1 Tax=Brugia timori TaxID=42155 RepID=A0A0R3QPQ0_9BILA|nr:unnamed protein product [Brugia timori]
MFYQSLNKLHTKTLRMKITKNDERKTCVLCNRQMYSSVTTALFLSSCLLTSFVLQNRNLLLVTAGTALGNCAQLNFGFRYCIVAVDDLLLAASVAATIFNVLVIFCAIKLFRRSGDTMHLFIISMSIGDLLLTVFCHPNEFLIRKHEFLRHARLCAITHFCNWLGLAVSGLSLTMLNIDKLIYFQWPLSYDRAIYVTWVWVFNVVYIGKNCNLQMTSDQMYFYDMFMVTYCVLPVTSSLIVSGYLYQLTREKRHNGASVGQSQKFKNKVSSFTPQCLFFYLKMRRFNVNCLMI